MTLSVKSSLILPWIKTDITREGHICSINYFCSLPFDYYARLTWENGGDRAAARAAFPVQVVGGGAGFGRAERGERPARPVVAGGQGENQVLNVGRDGLVGRVALKDQTLQLQAPLPLLVQAPCLHITQNDALFNQIPLSIVF